VKIKRIPNCAPRVQSALFSGAMNMESVVAFFLSGGARVNHHILKDYLTQLRTLLTAFEANRRFSLVGSSLLFVHDGVGLKSARRPRIRMIDFAHVVTAKTPTEGAADTGYITGLQTLIRCAAASARVSVNKPWWVV
jgi:hypothetical protein